MTSPMLCASLCESGGIPNRTLTCCVCSFACDTFWSLRSLPCTQQLFFSQHGAERRCSLTVLRPTTSKQIIWLWVQHPQGGFFSVLLTLDPQPYCIDTSFIRGSLGKLPNIEAPNMMGVFKPRLQMRNALPERSSAMT